MYAGTTVLNRSLRGSLVPVKVRLGRRRRNAAAGRELAERRVQVRILPRVPGAPALRLLSFIRAGTPPKCSSVPQSAVVRHFADWLSTASAQVRIEDGGTTTAVPASRGPPAFTGDRVCRNSLRRRTRRAASRSACAAYHPMSTVRRAVRRNGCSCRPVGPAAAASSQCRRHCSRLVMATLRHLRGACRALPTAFRSGAWRVPGREGQVVRFGVIPGQRPGDAAAFARATTFAAVPFETPAAAAASESYWAGSWRSLGIDRNVVMSVLFFDAPASASASFGSRCRGRTGAFKPLSRGSATARTAARIDGFGRRTGMPTSP